MSNVIYADFSAKPAEKQDEGACLDVELLRLIPKLIAELGAGGAIRFIECQLADAGIIFESASSWRIARDVMGKELL